jgi:hypothetical protein
MSPARTQAEIERDARENQRAREAMMRADGARTPGENLEQANALIKAAFELKGAFAAAERDR